MSAAMPQIAQTSACVYPRTQLWRAGAVSGRAVSRTDVREVVFAMCVRADRRSVRALGGAGWALKGELSQHKRTSCPITTALVLTFSPLSSAEN